jgi:hypothetical protein
MYFTPELYSLTPGRLSLAGLELLPAASATVPVNARANKMAVILIRIDFIFFLHLEKLSVEYSDPEGEFQVIGLIL